MARTNTGPRYWKSRGGYYCWFLGQQVLLAKGPKGDPDVQQAAREEFDQLVGTRVAPNDPQASFYAVANAFLVWAEEERSQATFRNRRVYLKGVVARYGKVPARDVTMLMAEQFMRAQKTWGPTSRNHFVTSLNACYNWAAERKLVRENPFRRMSKPPIRSRARNKDDLMTQETFDRLYAAAPGPTKDVLLALAETGARPHELFALTARDYNAGRATLGTEAGKNRRFEESGRAPRTLYVTDRLRPVIVRLSATHPTGPLFRNRVGAPWTAKTLGAWFKRTREELGVTGSVVPYSLRHFFCQRWLLNGGSVARLATIMDTSVRVIERHYSHLALEDRNFLKDIERLVGGRKDGPTAEDAGEDGTTPSAGGAA
jgi:integrase